MIYNTYELIWLFLIYSFLGWMLETILAATEQRRFVNRGLINGPLCTIYGIPIVILTIFGQELTLFWLFLGAMIVATVTEWISGHMIERFYHERWWDYSNEFLNIEGRVSLLFSIAWGMIGVIFVEKIHPFFEKKLTKMMNRIPKKILTIVLSIFVIGIGVDTIFSIIRYIGI